jgi:YD repeat-containing protein
VWDLNGNLTDDGSFTYSYDYRNQLIAAKQKGTGIPVAWYRYDALGRRVEKQLMTGPTERYILSGLETIQIYDNGGQWKQDFVYGEGIDQILMLQQPDVLDHDGDQDTTELARHYVRNVRSQDKNSRFRRALIENATISSA